MIREIDRTMLQDAIRTSKDDVGRWRSRFNAAVTQASPLPPARVKLLRNEITIDKCLEAARKNLEQAERLLNDVEVKNES